MNFTVKHNPILFKVTLKMRFLMRRISIRSLFKSKTSVLSLRNQNRFENNQQFLKSRCH